MEQSNIRQYSDALLQSVDTLIKKRISESKGAEAVVAEVVDVIDEGLGIYQIEYMGQKIEATSVNAENVYKKGDLITILIPESDLSQNVTILAPADVKKTDLLSYKSNAEYTALSENLLYFGGGQDKIIKLSSYKDEVQSIISEPDDFVKKVNSFLRVSRTFCFSCKIKTDIDRSRGSKGNYGVTYFIPVQVDGVEKEKQVTIDMNNILGDPFNLSTGVIQKAYFTLDEGEELVRNQTTVRGFVEGFVGLNDQDKTDYPIDIVISDIELYSVSKVKEAEDAGYSMSLVVSNGTAFINDTETSKTVSPQLFIKGRQTNLDEWECYQFRENYLINPGSDGYHKLGGNGQEILNDETNVTVDDLGRRICEYDVYKYSYKILREDLRTSLNYKCVLKKQQQVVSAITNIRNLKNNYDLRLESKTGSNEYVKNVGSVNLVVKYWEEGLTNTEGKATIIWKQQRYNSSGVYVDDDFYSVVRTNEVEKINEKNYQVTEISFPTNLISDFNVIKCSGFLREEDNVNATQMIGNESITINTVRMPDYSMTVVNADKLYKYDAEGTNLELESGIAIEPIGIQLFKPDNTEFTNEEYALTYLCWMIPKNTLLKINNVENYTADDKYYYRIGTYNECKSLDYSISNHYDKNKKDNNIIIKAYQNTTLSSTNIPTEEADAEGIAIFNFLKDGENGTNGTKYSAVITQNAGRDTGYIYEQEEEDGHITKCQLIYCTENGKQYIYNTRTKEYVIFDEKTENKNQKTFGIKMYCDGSEINVSEVTQKIFDNYNEKLVPETDGQMSPITISKENPSSNNGIISLVSDNKQHGTEKKGEEIIDCSTRIFGAVIEAKVRAKRSSNSDESQIDEDFEADEYVYAYYPIEATRISKLSLLDNINPDLTGEKQNAIPIMTNGYSEVMYATDGTNPQCNKSMTFTMTNNNFYDTKRRSKQGKILPNKINLITDDFIDLDYEYVQSASSNFKVSGSEGVSMTISPTTKYDSGKARNYIKAILGPDNEDYIEKVNKEIEKLETQITHNEGTITLDTNVDIALSVLFRGDEKYQNKSKNWQNGMKMDSIFLYVKNGLYDRMNKILTYLNNQKNQYSKNGGVTLPSINGIDPNIKKYNDALTYFDAQLKVIQNWGLIEPSEDNRPQSIDSSYKISQETIELNKSKSKYTMINYFSMYNNAIDLYNDFQTKNKTCCEDQQENTPVKIFYNIYDDMMKYFNFNGENETYQKAIVTKQPTLNFQIPDTLNIFMTQDGTILDNIQDKIFNALDIAFKNFNLYEINFENEIQELEAKNKELNSRIKTYKTIRDLPQESRADFIYIKPIVMYYNRYELSELNGWDGNKLEIDEKGNYILAPKIGAGKKEDDNSFTGMVMGVQNQGVQKKQTKIGLFGLSKGAQSLFLNAKDGSAIFGKSGGGQIIIDPRGDKPKGHIYSQNYYNEEDYDFDGKPKENARLSGKGMLIDFTAPEIKFGSGNFKVSSEGEITAKGGGEIAGQKINDTELFSDRNKKDGRIALNSGTYLYGYPCTTKRKINGGAEERTYNSIIFQDPLSTEGSNFKYFKETKDSREEKISKIEIDKEKNETTIEVEGDKYIGNNNNSTVKSYKTEVILDNSYIEQTEFCMHSTKYQSGGSIYSNAHESLDSTKEGFFLAKNGLSIGNTIKITAAEGGEVHVGRLSSSNHWTISGNSNRSYIAFATDEKYFTTNNQGDITINDSAKNKQIYIGTDGIRLGKKFAVDTDGNTLVEGTITARKGKIGDQTIEDGKIVGIANDGGNITLDANGSIQGGKNDGNIQKIDRSGNASFDYITADKGGKIGGQTINKGYLSNNNIYIDANNGKIYCADTHQGNTKQCINNDGSASFNNVSITGTSSMTGGSIKGNTTLSLLNGTKGITQDGSTLTIEGNGTFEGEIRANSGYIGDKTNGFKITSTGLSSSGVSIQNYASENPGSVYANHFITNSGCGPERFEQDKTTQTQQGQSNLKGALDQLKTEIDKKADK